MVQGRLDWVGTKTIRTASIQRLARVAAGGKLRCPSDGRAEIAAPLYLPAVTFIHRHVLISSFIRPSSGLRDPQIQLPASQAQLLDSSSPSDKRGALSVDCD